MHLPLTLHFTGNSGDTNSGDTIPISNNVQHPNSGDTIPISNNPIPGTPIPGTQYRFPTMSNNRNAA